MRKPPLQTPWGDCVVAATDAAGDGALGACTATLPADQWFQAYRLSEQRGEYVRLDWVTTDDAPPTALSDQRGSSALLAATLPWRTVLQLPPTMDRTPQHINVLEARAILQLLKRLVNRGARNARVLILSDSRVCVGAFGKGRSSSRALNAVIRKCAGIALRARLTWDIVWIPTWANPADAPSRGRSLATWWRDLPDWLPGAEFPCGLPPHYSATELDIWSRLLEPPTDPTFENFAARVQAFRDIPPPPGLPPLPGHDRAAAEYARLALLMAGDVEPDPLPRRGPPGLAAAMASQSGKSNPPPAPMTRTQPASCPERVPPPGVATVKWRRGRRGTPVHRRRMTCRDRAPRGSGAERAAGAESRAFATVARPTLSAREFWEQVRLAPGERSVLRSQRAGVSGNRMHCIKVGTMCLAMSFRRSETVRISETEFVLRPGNASRPWLLGRAARDSAHAFVLGSIGTEQPRCCRHLRATHASFLSVAASKPATSLLRRTRRRRLSMRTSMRRAARLLIHARMTFVAASMAFLLVSLIARL